MGDKSESLFQFITFWTLHRDKLTSAKTFLDTESKNKQLKSKVTLLNNVLQNTLEHVVHVGLLFKLTVQMALTVTTYTTYRYTPNAKLLFSRTLNFAKISSQIFLASFYFRVVTSKTFESISQQLLLRDIKFGTLLILELT